MPWIDPVSNVIVAVGAIVAVVIAYRGLQTWRDQVRGKSEHDCARAFLASILHFQEAIRATRFPGMYIDPESPEEGEAQGFQDRVRRLDEVMSEMRHSGIEADVLWGSKRVKAMLAPLIECYGELTTSIREYCRARSDTDCARRTTQEEIKRFQELRATVYGVGSPNDVFNNRVVEAVSRAETFLRPKINIQQ